MNRSWLIFACVLGVVPGSGACAGSGGSGTGDGQGPVGAGSTWSTVAAYYEPGALFSIHGTSPDDVWVVGGEEGRAVVLQLDATGWTEHDPGTGEQAWWVHAFEGGPVFVVGERGSMARYQDGAWEVMDSGVPGTVLYGVWGASPEDMWAVGGPSLHEKEAALEGDVVLRYDGQSWERVAVPALEAKEPTAQGRLFKVWGAKADHVVVVGHGSDPLHFDGQTWTEHASPASGQPLFTVTGRNHDDVYAVGGFGLARVIHWDGSAWSEVPLGDSAPQIVQGIWTAPGQDVYVAGMSGYTASLGAGGTWTEMDVVTGDTYHGIWGDGQGGVFACGGNIVASLSDYHGVLAVMGRDVPEL